MMRQIVDLHIHSKYARACSPLLELPNIGKACETKGIDICATGDFTHPSWFEHIEEMLSEIGSSGLYRLKSGNCKTKFILSVEVSCIYKHKDKVRRLHLVILAPNLEAARKFNDKLKEKGVNLRSDGRPIMGLSAKEVLRTMLEIDPRFLMIPAHAWTPWFAVFGSKSGYDSLEECFEELTPHIKVIETGLSSDPTMNRRLKQLDNIILVSNSDAHSLENLGREANVLAFANEKMVTYENLINCLVSNDKSKFLHTIEFYPEEGMYFVDGHRACGVSMYPEDSKKINNICPKCKREFTIGVLHRVDDLADRKIQKIDSNKFISHKYVVPLREIIAEVFDVGVKSKKVEKEYANLIEKFGNEFNILMYEPIENMAKQAIDSNIAVGIDNVRKSEVIRKPGYDGQYGRINTIRLNNKKSAV